MTGRDDLRRTGARYSLSHDVSSRRAAAAATRSAMTISALFRFTARATRSGFAAAALVIAAAIAVGGLAPLARAQEAWSIAAVVNDDAVSVYELGERTRLAVAVSGFPDTPETRSRLTRQILGTMIEERLQFQEAARLGITVSDQEIQSAIAQIERQNRMPPGGLVEFLRQSQVDLKALADQIRASIAWSKVVRQRIRPRVDIGEDEIDDYLNQLRARGGSMEYAVAEIFLAVDRGVDDAEVRRTAERLIEQIRQGVPFAALARQFSQAATAAVGGDMGRVYEGQIDPRLEASLQAMGPQEISSPIRLEDGFHILYLASKRRIEAPRPEDAMVSLRRIFLRVPPAAPPADVAAQEALVQTVSANVQGCSDMDRVGAEMDAAQPVDIGRVRVGDLPAALRGAISDLPIETASQPVRLADGFIVLMVCERTEPDGGLPSRDEVRDNLSQQRIEVMARRLLDDLRQAAFVDIRLS